MKTALADFGKDFNNGLLVLFIICAIIYDLSPIDLCSDLVPVVGLIDDIIISLSAFCTAYMKWRKI